MTDSEAEHGATGFAIGAVVAGFIGLLATLSVGGCVTDRMNRQWERTAISRGLATYNDKGEFVWKEKAEAAP